MSDCLGGACPHDHTVELECWLCNAEFDSAGQTLCPRCGHLMALGQEDLALMVVELTNVVNALTRGAGT